MSEAWKGGSTETRFPGQKFCIACGHKVHDDRCADECPKCIAAERSKA